MSGAIPPTGVTVATVLRDLAESRALDLDLLGGGGGLDRRISNPHPQRMGLALTGFHDYLRDGRVFVLGDGEMQYLERLSRVDRVNILRRVLGHALPCVIITDGFEPQPELPGECDLAQVPLLRTHAPAPEAMSRLSVLLDAYLAERGIIHGVLMDILGLGVLVIGESGIGKSECALDLVARGHRLVADDAVELRSQGGTHVLGSCPELTRHHMEIRGLGLINVQDLFGVASTRGSKRVEFVVELERWEQGREYDRLGLDESYYDLLGVRVPMILIPVAPGRNVAILVEVAARNRLLQTGGHHAARRLVHRFNNQIGGAPAAAVNGTTHDNGEDL